MKKTLEDILKLKMLNAQRGQLKNSKVFISIVLNNDLQTLGPNRLKKVPVGRAGKMVTY